MITLILRTNQAWPIRWRPWVCRRSNGAAKAVVDEVGANNVHPVTKQVAKMQVHNANRDLFRFIRLPLDLSWVSCPVYSRPGSSEVIEAKLPMYDPHELLEYLWKTGRLKVKTSTLQIHSCVHYNFYRFCGFISYPIKKNMWVSNFEFPIRKYWEHWSSVASWGCKPPWKGFQRYACFHLWGTKLGTQKPMETNS